MREPWLVLVFTWARADGLSGTPGMSPALNYKAYSNWSLATYPFFSSSKLLLATPTHLPSICPFTRPHVLISALSMHLDTCTLGLDPCARHSLFGRTDPYYTDTISTPPAAFSALPQHLTSPFSVIVLSSQYLFQRGPIWIYRYVHTRTLRVNQHDWYWIWKPTSLFRDKYLPLRELGKRSTWESLTASSPQPGAVHWMQRGKVLAKCPVHILPPTWFSQSGPRYSWAWQGATTCQRAPSRAGPSPTTPSGIAP